MSDDKERPGAFGVVGQLMSFILVGIPTAVVVFAFLWCLLSGIYTGSTLYKNHVAKNGGSYAER